MTEQPDEPEIQAAYLRCRSTSDPAEADKAFTELVILARPRIERIVRSRLTGEFADLAESAVVLVEVKLWRAVQDPRAEDLDSVIAWLVTASRTTCIDEWRKQNKTMRGKTVLTDPARIDPGPGAHLGESDPAEIVGGLFAAFELWKEIEGYCKGKKPWVLKIARLTFREELRPQEIARRLNEGPQYARWREEHGLFTPRQVSGILSNMREALREGRNPHDGE